MRKASEMKNKIFPIFLTLTGLLFVLQGFSGCAHPHSSFSSSDSSNKKTVLITAKIQNLPSVNTSESERLAKSAFPVLSDTLTYSLSYKPQGSSTAWQAMTGSYPDFQLISPSGTYILKLEGFSDAEKTNLILTGQASVTIDEDSVVKTVSFIVQPPENATGNGSVSLKLSATSDTNISAFTLTATKTGSTEISLIWKCSAPDSPSSGTVKANIPAGSYTVTITGIANNKPVYSRTEKFTVWEGLTTSSWIMADGTVTDELMIKAEDLYSIFYVKGSSGPYNFYNDGVFGDVIASDSNSGSMGSPLETVSAAVNKCVVSNKPYTIYVDGTVNEVNYSPSDDPTAISILNGKQITIKSLNPSDEKKAVIQADGKGRIMYAGGTVVLEDLVLKGGSITTYGGGIYVDSAGVLTMKNCTITECHANLFGGGLYISPSGSAKLTGCTISGNNASYGTGIYLDTGGTLSVSSTIIDSHTFTGYNGALYINSGTATLTDCTFFGNTDKTTGSAVYFKDGTLNLNGKIQSGADDFYIPTGKYITIQTPLSDDSSVLVTPSDHINNTQILQAEDGVTLADEAGKFKISNTDYIISKEGKLCYLGTTSTTAADNIAVFTNIPAGCEATVNLDNLAQTDWSGAGSAEISGNVTLTASSATTISSSGNIFTVKNGGTLKLSDNVTLTTTNPLASVKVEEGGTLILDGAEITSSSTTNPTGVSITKGKLIINSGTISGIQGSAIVATDSEITITGGTISNNKGSGSSSTINLTNCTADIENLTVTDNYANWYGGGIIISGGGTYTFTNCEILNNSTGYSNGAPGYGGGIYIDTTGTVTFTGCTITGNSAINNGSSSKGGGIYLKSGTLTTTGCTISDNKTKNSSTVTTGNGSQIYAVAGSVYNGTTLTADKVID